MGVIDRDKIKAYADSEDLDFTLLAADLRAMDGAFLDWSAHQRKIENEKREREAKLKEKRNGARGGR